MTRGCRERWIMTELGSKSRCPVRPGSIAPLKTSLRSSEGRSKGAPQAWDANLENSARRLTFRTAALLVVSGASIPLAIELTVHIFRLSVISP